MAIRVMTSPVGSLTLQSRGDAVCAVLYGRRGEPAEAGDLPEGDTKDE